PDHRVVFAVLHAGAHRPLAARAGDLGERGIDRDRRVGIRCGEARTERVVGPRPLLGARGDLDDLRARCSAPDHRDRGSLAPTSSEVDADELLEVALLLRHITVARSHATKSSLVTGIWPAGLCRVRPL